MFPARRLIAAARYSRRLSVLPSPNPNPSSGELTPISGDRSQKHSLGSSVRSLLKEYDPDKLVSLFKSRSESPIFRSKPGVYDVVVHRLTFAGRRDLVRRLLDDQQRFVSSEGFASRLISLYGKAGMPDEAALLFDRLPALSCPRTTRTFNTLLTAFSASGDDRRISELLKEAHPTIVPDAVSYNILVMALCSKGQHNAAVEALGEMEANSVDPNQVTFNIILNALYQNGLFEKADEVWRTMEEKGIDPDIRAFNSKIRALVGNERLSEAVELVEHLENTCVKPDVYTYNALIKGYCDGGRLDDAYAIYKGLGKKDCPPNRTTFEILAMEFCKAGRCDTAVKLCNMSISVRDCVGVEVLQEVIDGLAKSAMFEEAKTLLQRAKLKSFTRNKLKAPLSCLFV